ncbi:hypothetical protein DMA11_11950 [Marinilabiliaceae bacterium JC017]|nr:hypothetical protein DMA11_11950 [Marinilabiliaceae bacterium JC017]
MKRLLTQILLIIVCLSAAAQVHYPIRTFTILNSPLPYTLSGFASEPGRMMLNINVDDISLDQYAVKFRLNIQGNGIRLYTKPTMHQEPFFMDGGINESFTGMDLEQFFNPDNLIFEGYSRNEYKRNGRLPEGVYRISVDVLDYYRGFNVSQATPGMAMIYLTRAPRLTFPATQTEVDPGGVPNIRFSWLATMPADPLADVAYRFRLWEIRPAGRDPYEMVQVSAPVFSEEVDAANFIYDISRPPLIDGMWYAWQVQAFDREGRALFKNDGKSEVFSFRYGKSCMIPELVITGVGHTDVSLRWSGDGSVQLYRLFYKRTDDSDWQQAETGSLTYKLEGLDDNTGYELKVQSICSDTESDFSRVVRCKTDRIVDYTCGAKGDEFDLSNTEPLVSLGKYDEFKAADFVIEVEEASGSGGSFSGTGYALVPYLNFLKFKVTFDNITINSDRRMIDGSVAFVYDESTGFVVGLGGGKGKDKGEDNTQLEVVDVKEQLEKATDELIEVDGEVTDVKVDGNTVIITKKDGSTQQESIGNGETVGVIPSDGDQVYVADQASGQVFVVNKNSTGGSASTVGTASQTGQYGCTTTFLPAKNQRYGFDAVGDGRHKPDTYFKKSKGGDLIHWKSLGAGTTDFVDLSIQGDVSPDSLRYLRESGVLTPVSPSGKNQRLLLTGLAGGEEDILTVALATSQQVNDSTKQEKLTETGALGIVAYDRILRDVVLVPVNGAQCPESPGIIKTELNKIYAPAVVDWEVSIAPNLAVTKLSTDGFKVEEIESSYTKDMNRVISTFIKEHRINKETLYLFFVNVPNISSTGYMPLSGPYGFIFNFGSNTTVLAHELAHGAFNLRHVFDSQNEYFLSERSSENLMDHSNGDQLWKYQWDLIHSPETVIIPSFDESEEDSNSENDTNNDKSKVVNQNIGFNIKGNDQVRFGPILITLKSDPVKSTDNSDAECKYSVDKVDFELVLDDKAIGKYSSEIVGAQLSYVLDCKTGMLKSADITWEQSNGIEIKDIGFIDALITKVNLKINTEGVLSGAVNFAANLNKDKNISSLVVVRKGLRGDFRFDFMVSDDNVYAGSFDLSGINGVEIDLIKSDKIIASVAKGTLNATGSLTADLKLGEPVTYSEKGFSVSLKSLEGNVTYQIGESTIKFNSISGSVSIGNIPGINTSIDLSFEKADNFISGTVTKMDKIKFYGMEFDAKKLKVQFTNQFELEAIEGKNIVATYSNTKDDKTLMGEIMINHVLISDNSIQKLTGGGTVSYVPFAKVILSGGEYNVDDKSVHFAANVDVKASENNQAKTTISKVIIKKDGSFEIGEVSIDAIMQAGPLTVEFESKPRNSKNIKSVEAKVSLKVKEGDVDKTVSFRSKVDYKKDKSAGITYVKVQASDLDIEFPEIYSIDSKVRSVSFEYAKNEDGTDDFAGTITLDASLKEDKYIYKDLVKLKKGVEGTISYVIDSKMKDNPLGYFDLSNLKNLKLELIKEDKPLAIFSGSISQAGLMSGKFKVVKEQAFASSGFKATLKKFDIDASYHLKDSEFNFKSGKGAVVISDIRGIEGQIGIELEYLNNNCIASLAASQQGLQFCKMEMSDLFFELTMDTDLNLKKINGGFAIQPEGMTSKLCLSEVLIEEGKLKSLKSSGNIDYNAFKFDILNASYANSKMSINAKVLLGDSYVAVDKFEISSEGKISIGKAEGSINKSLMAIRFDAAFSDDRFQGSFDAIISKKLNVSGTVDMGSSACSACDEGSYSFGYYSLTVGSAIPVFPGISISKLGGRFGYNYSIDFQKKERYGTPKYGNNLAGLSFGLQDNAGIVELAVDPAIYQWGNEKASLSLQGTIIAPKTNPVFRGEANITLAMPSYDIYGNIEADVKIPAKSGWILNANQTVKFNMTERVKSFSTTNMNASILKVMNFNGSFDNTRNYNEAGVLTSAKGHLDGNLGYGFTSQIKKEGTGYSLDCKFDFDFNAYLSTDFTDQGLKSASFGGNIHSSGSVDVKALGCEFSPYCSVDGEANVKYINPSWKMDASYKLVVGLEKIGETTIDGRYSYTFTE